MGKLYEDYLEEQEWHCPECDKKWTTKREKSQCKCFACGKTLTMTKEEKVENTIASKYLK